VGYGGHFIAYDRLFIGSAIKANVTEKTPAKPWPNAQATTTAKHL
jgi:hypothetical protein